MLQRTKKDIFLEFSTRGSTEPVDIFTVLPLSADDDRALHCVSPGLIRVANGCR